jgi:hypothetical protein
MQGSTDGTAIGGLQCPLIFFSDTENSFNSSWKTPSISSTVILFRHFGQTYLGEREKTYILWPQRAKTVGYPERFAQEALGHNSKAVHRANEKRALMKIPSLEDYERQAAVKVAPVA